MMIRNCIAAAAVGLLLIGSIGCHETGSTKPAGTSQPGARSERSGATMTLTSSAFADGKAIPIKHAGARAGGQNVSPPLAWAGAPAGVKQFALIVTDPDGKDDHGRDWVHWIVYAIPGSAASLPEGLPNIEELASPAGAMQGVNSFSPGQFGYGGPTPPTGLHHYHFKLYALDQEIPLKPAMTKADLESAMHSHILATGELVGTYKAK